MSISSELKDLEIEGRIGGSKDKINNIKKIVRQKKLTTGRIPSIPKSLNP
ncbi:hypothetical protein D1AOALGA4SA_12217 [Olavius algarvensis Delta 1 endosymbiont]|nr:hypothetical protein D1AOALGA4SA_12217 [Olavius algarvensis Delta 1 endosymbiont]